MSKVAKKLYATDETFREVADLLFGGGADELVRDIVAKASPDGADLSAHMKRKKRERTEARVGLATNIIGLGAGAAATPGAFKQAKKKIREAKGLPAESGKPRSALATRVGSLKAVRVANETLSKPKVAAGLAVGGAALQTANLGGDVVANRVLGRAAKKDPNVKGGSSTAVRVTHSKVKDEFKKHFRPLPKQEVSKSDESEILWEGEFSKFDTDKRQVFGWASIVKKDGEDVVDLQGDYISIEEIEKSAYDYVVKSRKGGNQHRRNGEEPFHAADMIESFIVTPEKIEKMGLPESTPLGWWVGYKINDEETWNQVKSGERTGFSIHGKGRREPHVSR